MAIGRISINEPFMPSIQCKKQQQPTQSKATFLDTLKQESNKINFSQHALTRLESRQIKLTEDDLSRLNNTIEQMARKGARESLIYMKNTAFVVSINNKTVITAMDGNEMKDNIFTNIDSAAIL